LRIAKKKSPLGKTRHKTTYPYHKKGLITIIIGKYKKNGLTWLDNMASNRG